MDDKLYQLLKKAYGIVGNRIVSLEQSGSFTWIYPFTTENISGYIDVFDLENKSLVTVGSSADQVINTALKGCSSQTILDICPFTKYYFYLKKAAILTLDYEKFTEFLCCDNYYDESGMNYGAFNISYWNELSEQLKEIDYNSFVFWNHLFYSFKPFHIRSRLFSRDECGINSLKQMNLYLKNEEMFNQTKMIIKDVNPKFITEDIFKVKLKEKYDNIFLSNLNQYYSISVLKSLIENLESNLNENGRMLMCYLYHTQSDSLDEYCKVLGNYVTDFHSFTGRYGCQEKVEKIKDSILIYKKK